MSAGLRSCKQDIYLVGETKHQITGAKLPSNRQVLAVLFYNIREVKLTVGVSASLVIKECSIFWEKARIPTKGQLNCVKKLMDLYQVWRELQKNCKKTQDVFKLREEDFGKNLDNLFDIAHADALQMIKIQEDRIFLLKQRECGRPGCLAGIDKKFADKEDRVRLRKLGEENRRLTSQSIASTSSAPDYMLIQPDMTQGSDEDQLNISASSSEIKTADASAEPEIVILKPNVKRGRKDFITPKLVAALDRCQLSIRDSVYILQAAIEAFKLTPDEYPINKSTIQRVRTQIRKQRAETIKTDFQNNVPEVVTVHWDGKLMPGLDVRSSKEERLPILITFDEREQLLAVPKLDSSSGKEQAQAVINALQDWSLEDKVQIMCCDTTASNTGRFNGACAILEQKLERDLLLFSCRHHVYELVLKSVFEAKIPQVTSSPDIPLFKKFRDNWKNMETCDIELPTDFLNQHVKTTDIQELEAFYRSELKKAFVRDDYRELVELSIIFLGKDENKELRIRPPGAMHQARWMARAIYSLKICLLQSQFKMTTKEKQALLEVSLFIATVYVQPWLKCSLAVSAPNQDLSFIKTLKAYESVDKTISKAGLTKFCQHLWYLTEETVCLSLFDDNVNDQTKTKMVANLQRESLTEFRKRYVPTSDEISYLLYAKSLDDFVTNKSKNLFTRLKIDDSFLEKNVSDWEGSASFQTAKRRVTTLKAVNDTAERGVKLMQDFHKLITANEEQKQFLLRCVQEHRNRYPDCKKATLKRKYPE